MRFKNIPVSMQVCVSACRGGKAGTLLLYSEHNTEEGRKVSGPAQRCPSGSACSLRKPQAALSYSLCSRSAACLHIFTLGLQPCCICGIAAGRQSSSLALLSCGSQEHEAVLRLLEGRQLQKPHTAGTATQPCLQRTLLAFSSAVVQEEKDPGKDRTKTKSPQTSSPPQPSLV